MRRSLMFMPVFAMFATISTSAVVQGGAESLVLPDTDLIGQLATTGETTEVADRQSRQPAPQDPDTFKGVSDKLPDGLTSEVWLGAEAHDKNGNSIGKVVDLVENDNGGARTVVVETGGLVLGIGARRVAVPGDQVRFPRPGEARIAMTEEEIERLPEHR